MLIFSINLNYFFRLRNVTSIFYLFIYKFDKEMDLLIGEKEVIRVNEYFINSY